LPLDHPFFTQPIHKPVGNGRQDQVALAFAHIALGLRFEQRMALKENYLACGDLIADPVDQRGSDIFQHNVLERKASQCALHQGTLA
jgi:hypothetical protein